MKKICYILLFLLLFACSDDPESKKDNKIEISNSNYDKNGLNDAKTSVSKPEINEKCAKSEDSAINSPNLIADLKISQPNPIKTTDIIVVGPLGKNYQPMPPNCIDNDGDYYGKYCGWGDDCDDNNPNFNVYCPDCTKKNYKGCPCLSAATSCYSKDMKYIGVGPCKTGLQKCKNGFWEECIGEITPIAEACDGWDNDCDGLIDDGVMSTCLNCDFDCIRQVAKPKTDNPFIIVPKNAVNVKLNKDGNVILKSGKVIPLKFSYIWIANSGESTVSKLDTKTGAEVARYKACSDPSRTAVDLKGDVWVGCRGDGGVMKIAGSLKNCVDVNGNGKIDTVEDTNKNKKIETKEMLPYLKDECVKFVVYPEGKGNWASVPRAAGVDKNNFGWIGFWYKEKLIKLHPQTGKKVDTIELKCSPYGLAISKTGIVWIAGRGCDALLRVNPKTKKVDKIPYDQGSPYGMAIDSFGNIWMANTASLTSCYNTKTKKWTHVKHSFWSRGVATSNTGHVYVALDSNNAIAKINAKTMKLEKEISVGNGRYPVGIAVDHDGFVWAINQFKNSATKVDPKKANIIGEYPVGQGPYTYSDMTGYALLNYTLPTGYYVHTFGIFFANYYTAQIKTLKKWELISIEGKFPEGSYTYVYYRTGLTPSGMEKKPWLGPLGPIPGVVLPIDIKKENIKGYYFQVKVELHAGFDKKVPILESIMVESHVVN